ncbi:MAG: hypothetical protein JWM37_270 [Candidatus Saccharibacteria bacterium]|nr:hypothetical protein [Candidatus Saccharibacteria bacterium]
MAERLDLNKEVKLTRRSVLAAGVALLISGAAIGIGGNAIIHNSHEPLAPASESVTIPWVSPTVLHWKKDIEEMSAKYDIDPNLTAIIMTLESGGWSKAGSEAGAQGLMQVTPPTAGDIAKMYLKEPVDHYDIWDPRTNIEFGVAYLAHLRDEFGDPDQGPGWEDTVEQIAMGYNGGPGVTNEFLKGHGVGPDESLIYSRDARNMWLERGGSQSLTYNRWLERGGQTLIDHAREEQK